MSSIKIETPPSASATVVEALVRAFESCKLPREEWTHAAHLTVALWYLIHHDWLDAVHLMREGIKRYNEASGVVTTRERGYHETLTLFWLHTVRTFLDDHHTKDRALLSLANELIASADKNLPLEYYSRDRLMSWEARTGWVEPDLKQLS